MSAEERDNYQKMLNNTPVKLTDKEFSEEATMVKMAMEALAECQKGNSYSLDEAKARLSKWLY